MSPNYWCLKWRPRKAQNLHLDNPSQLVIFLSISRIDLYKQIESISSLFLSSHKNPCELFGWFENVVETPQAGAYVLTISSYCFLKLPLTCFCMTGDRNTEN